MRLNLAIHQIVDTARKTSYTASLGILVALFLIINALRLMYGVKHIFLFLLQTVIFIIILFEPKFLNVMTKPERSNNVKKSMVQIFAFLAIIPLWYLTSFALSLTNVYSIIASLIITFILWKPFAFIILHRIGFTLLTKRLLFNSIVATLISLLIIIGGSYVIFNVSIIGLHSLDSVGKYVSSRTYTEDLPKTLLRSNNDLYLWILFGAGACGEMAFVTKTILEGRGYETYVAGFPGEDHMFAVVYVNGSWIVIDPGYPQCRVASLSERVRCRVGEMGNISSIVVYIDERGYIELTQYYVPYDTFVIHVTYRGHPVAGACVTLQHLFDGKTTITIPGGVYCYYTNSTGYVVIHLGGSVYNNTKIEPYKPYFEIYVNGKPTGICIQSTASGKTHSIEIDLHDLG